MQTHAGKSALHTFFCAFSWLINCPFHSSKNQFFFETLHQSEWRHSKTVEAVIIWGTMLYIFFFLKLNACSSTLAMFMFMQNIRDTHGSGDGLGESIIIHTLSLCLLGVGWGLASVATTHINLPHPCKSSLFTSRRTDSLDTERLQHQQQLFPLFSFTFFSHVN